jgi:hypothetical protein
MEKGQKRTNRIESGVERIGNAESAIHIYATASTGEGKERKEIQRLTWTWDLGVDFYLLILPVYS